MLPQSHVAYTVAAVSLLQRRVPGMQQLDYRLVALAAMGPDLVDKPLAAVYFYRKYQSAVLFAHTLLAHAVVLLAVWRWRPAWLPYALIFNGHAVLDRLWFFPDTWYWPLRGWRFHVWRKRGSEQTTLGWAYWYTFTRRPELWGWELGGLVAGLWFVWYHRLYRVGRLGAFLRSGQVPADGDQPDVALWPQPE
jgi:inner membrane protein